MSKILPDDFFFGFQRGVADKRLKKKTTWPISRGQFKYPVGVFLSISGGGAAIWWVHPGERGRAGGLRWSFPLSTCK